MFMKDLIKQLKVLMSDVVTMYFQAHGYHWNVEGQDFSQYHSLFADIYEDVYGSIDPIAEMIRKLDDYAPFGLQEFIDTRTVSAASVEPDPKAMAKALLKSNEGVLKSLQKTFDLAIKADKQGVANFLADRIDQHDKWSWQLKSSTK
jgi:starvation-inducible DNA-binding protein